MFKVKGRIYVAIPWLCAFQTKISVVPIFIKSSLTRMANVGKVFLARKGISDVEMYRNYHSGPVKLDELGIYVAAKRDRFWFTHSRYTIMLNVLKRILFSCICFNPWCRNFKSFTSSSITSAFWYGIEF